MPDQYSGPARHQPRHPPSRPRRRRALWTLFQRFFRPHLGLFLAGTLFAALTAACAAGYVQVLRLIGEGIERAASGSESADPQAATAWVWWAIIGIVGFSSGRALSLYLMTLANNTGVQRALVEVQQAQFDALTRGDFARLAGDASGGFVSRFVNDVNAIRDAGLRFANNFTKSVLTVLGMFIAMLVMDWQLTLILLAAYPLAFGPVVSLGNRVRKRAKRAQQQVGEVTALLSEAFQGARSVKAYTLEQRQSQRARRGFEDRSRLFLKVLRDKAAVDPILEVTGGVALALIIGFSAWRIATGDGSLGALLGIIGAIGIAAPEIRALGTLNAVAQEGGAAADRVLDILDSETMIADRPGAAALGQERGKVHGQVHREVHGAVRFEDVRFGYGTGGPVLDGVSFAVAPGEMLALVGPSGAGKSTVIDLLLRLYDPEAGQITVDGTDIRTVTGHSLRANIALVAQDAALFDGTVAENIALGRADMAPGREAIEAAARAAHADDFIARLEGGYDAPVGEGGRNLSGGQRQRIALARAILRDAPILLLDEATSALDAESEAKVQAALAAHAKDRTVIVVAHRLSTVRAADRILVMDGGVIAEEGSHAELRARKGVYSRLVALQG
ncbi:MAG: ABC transporter ATP-binding protein [Pseudomonadota bacterium]